MSAPRTVSAALAQELAARITDYFGVMGNGNAYLLDALLNPTVTGTDVTYTAVRHEAGAVTAADAYYRAGGRLAAAVVTYGPGFTNTLTALAESAQAHVPLLLLTGSAPQAGPRAWDVDQAGLAAALGVPTVTVTIDDPQSAVVQAFTMAVARRAPVALAIPYGSAERPCGASLHHAAATSSSRQLHTQSDQGHLNPSERDITLIVTALREAARPILLAGRGAWLSGAGEALGQVARACGAVTMTTALARGIFPDARHDLGVAGGFGHPEAMRRVHDADVAVVFGAALNQFSLRFGALFSRETRVIQVDIVAEATSRVVTDFVRADAARTAKQVALRLLAGEPTCQANETRSREDWRTIDTAALHRRDEGGGMAADGRLDPRSVAARLGTLLPVDRVVVSDGGHFIGWANMYWPVAAPNRMIMVGTAFQAIGQGFGSVAGAARALPDASVVLTTGDGGGLMAAADFETAIRVAGGRGIAVVWNDAAYGAEINLYGLKGLNEEPARIPEIDFAALACALGAQGIVVRHLDDLDVLMRWRATPTEERRFLLLDCRISPHVIAPYQREIIAAHG